MDYNRINNVLAQILDPNSKVELVSLFGLSDREIALLSLRLKDHDRHMFVDRRDNEHDGMVLQVCFPDGHNVTAKEFLWESPWTNPVVFVATDHWGSFVSDGNITKWSFSPAIAMSEETSRTSTPSPQGTDWEIIETTHLRTPMGEVVVEKRKFGFDGREGVSNAYRRGERLSIVSKPDGYEFEVSYDYERYDQAGFRILD